jgi:hypothetical protein
VVFISVVLYPLPSRLTPFVCSPLSLALGYFPFPCDSYWELSASFTGEDGDEDDGNALQQRLHSILAGTSPRPTKAPPGPGGGEFGSSSGSAIEEEVEGEEVEGPPAVFSKEERDFLMRCLQLQPELRPTAEELLQHPFVQGSSMAVEFDEQQQEEEQARARAEEERRNGYQSPAQKQGSLATKVGSAKGGEAAAVVAAAAARMAAAAAAEVVEVVDEAVEAAEEPIEDVEEELMEVRDICQRVIMRQHENNRPQFQGAQNPHSADQQEDYDRNDPWGEKEGEGGHIGWDAEESAKGASVDASALRGGMHEQQAGGAGAKGEDGLDRCVPFPSRSAISCLAKQLDIPTGKLVYTCLRLGCHSHSLLLPLLTILPSLCPGRLGRRVEQVRPVLTCTFLLPPLPVIRDYSRLHQGTRFPLGPQRAKSQGQGRAPPHPPAGRDSAVELTAGDAHVLEPGVLSKSPRLLLPHSREATRDHRAPLQPRRAARRYLHTRGAARADPRRPGVVPAPRPQAPPMRAAALLFVWPGQVFG